MVGMLPVIWKSVHEGRILGKLSTVPSTVACNLLFSACHLYSAGLLPSDFNLSDLRLSEVCLYKSNMLKTPAERCCPNSGDS